MLTFSPPFTVGVILPAKAQVEKEEYRGIVLARF